MIDKCPKCGSRDFDDDICTNCGLVMDSNAIISTIEFQENGQFVSNTGVPLTSQFNGNIPFPRSNQNATINQGKHKITEIASVLNMSYYVDHALNLFSIAVQHNFIQGRHLDDVCAACLYIISRIHKTPHMLIDFADTLNVNVYTLGSVYMKLRNILDSDCPGLKTVDPSLYIHRFADKLDLGDKKHIVTLTALRLVARMKRDWITRGRRPTGICAAALLIASKMHGFNKGRKDILDVIKVGEKTLKDRMTEFNSTPCGSMTPEEFELLAQQTNDFAVDDVGYSLQDDGLVECNPPSYIKSKIKEKIKKQKDVGNNNNNSENNNNNNLITKDGYVIDLTDITTPGYILPSNFIEKKRMRSNKVYDEMINEIKEMNSILTEENEIKKNDYYDDNIEINNNNNNPPEKEEVIINNEKQQQQSPPQSQQPIELNINNNNNNNNITSLSQSKTLTISTQPNDNNNNNNNQIQSQPQTQTIITEESDVEDDFDVSCYLLNDNECKEKQMLWERNNKDWEEKQKEKKLLEDDGKLPKKRKKYNPRVNFNATGSAADSVKRIADSLKTNKKVNYEILQGIFSNNDDKIENTNSSSSITDSLFDNNKREEVDDYL